MSTSRRAALVSALAVALAVTTGFAACAFWGGSEASRTGGPGGSGNSGAWPGWSGIAAATGTAGQASGADASSGAPGSPTNGPTGGTTSGPTGGTTNGPTGGATGGSTHPPTAGPTITSRPGTPTPAPTSGGPCYVFPWSNVWNRDISALPVASNSATMVNAIGVGAYLHPDFDAIGDGIPYNIVDSSTPTYYPGFYYGDESDPGPYPIPSSPRIEAGSDHHLLTLDLGQCKLWEIYDASRSGSGWSGGSGAIFDLRSNALRPDGWTSADAAGLPIFPGLVRYSEVLTGSIQHAIRFTVPDTCGHIYPARHQTADPCSNLPPMGLRVRLKASVDISGFGPHARIVLTALKRYGMILADNGAPWYITGAPDTRWDDDEFHALQNLHGTDFEVVDTGGLRNG